MVKYGLTGSYGNHFILRFTALASSLAPRARLPLYRFSISRFYLRSGALYSQSRNPALLLKHPAWAPLQGPAPRPGRSCCSWRDTAGRCSRGGSARLHGQEQGLSHGKLYIAPPYQEQVKESNWVQRCLSFPTLFPLPRGHRGLRRGTRGSETPCSGMATPEAPHRFRGPREHLGLPTRAGSGPGFPTSSVFPQTLVRFAGGAKPSL